MPDKPLFRRLRLPTLAVLFVVMAGVAIHEAANPPLPSTTPRTNADERWRIGYLDGGPWVDYPLHLRSLVKGLMDQGWTVPAPLLRSADRVYDTIEGADEIPEDD